MKTKFSGILTLLLALVVQITFAQEQLTVTGTVTDENGMPLPGVNVLIKGTTRGVQTDFDGNYAIEASQGEVLVFSYIGMKTAEFIFQDVPRIDAVLTPDAAQLDEVVVTALGIQREKKSLGYASQEVSGDAVNTVKDANFVNSLSGKIAGIDVKSSGTLGGSTNVVIRGYSSLYGSNQALFVVDGVPISNMNTNSSDQVSGRAGYDYGNAAADINPDNIESINVLKGGAATALYGSRAANGVIVITTKKGKGANQGIGVTINSSVTFNKYNEDTFATYQKEYGAGYWIGVYHDDFYYKDGEPYVLADWDGSYGPAFDPTRLVHQWNSFYPQLEDTFGQATPWVAGEHDPSYVFETGTSVFNSVFLDGASDKGNFKLGYSKTDVSGILPNSQIKRDNVDFSASYNLTEKLTAAATASYNKTSGKGRYGTGYDSQNFMQTSRQWWQTNVDMKAQKEAFFQTKENITWNTSYIDEDLHAIYHDNFYWMRYNNYETDLRNRLIGNFNLTYELTDWLDVFGRATIDTYSGNQEERINNGGTAVSSYSIFNEFYTQNNYDVQLQLDRDLSDDLNVKAIVGTNILREHYSSLFASTNGGINIDGLWALSNSKNAINAPTQYEYTSGTNGYFANVSLGFRNMLYAEGSYRIDVASTLPEDNNQYDYYGVSGSFLFSELLNTNFINLGKLRVGYAKTGNAASPLTLYNTFDLNTPVQGQPSASLPSVNNNSNLKNEESTEKEIGLEMMFANNRAGFDFSLYDKTSSDLLTNISVTSAIGYSGQWLNAGELQNKGIELALWGSPIKTDDFEWRIDLNWAKNESKVLSLPAGLTNLQLASLQEGSINATVGEPYGMIRGSNFEFDENGNRIINPTNGRYLVTESENENLGTYQPDWKGGLNNSIRFKNISLSFLIDVQKGGNVFSLDTWYGMATGLYPETAGLNELGNPKRDPLTDGADSGGIILPGVIQTGTDGDGNPISDGTPNTVRTDMSNFANALGYTRAPTALHVYDAGFVKLREVALSYSLPAKVLDNMFFTSATFSAIGRNLWIIDKDIPYSDPEAGLSSGNVQGYQSGAYPTTKDYGFSVKLQF
ncbi:MAG: SusC/RagA family TonB-linked outer membrane protein [Salinimicrobium sediminis]|nr:SusC/RagA family TonB-linked outer membrane protein [Salinimicrobium sediminis]